jgi:predicted dehydrogenase
MKSGIDVNVTVTNVDTHGDGLSVIIEGDDQTLRVVSAQQDYGRGLRLESVRLNGTKILAEEREPPAGTDTRIPPFQRFATRLLKAVQKKDTTFRPSFEDGMRTQTIRDIALKTDQNGQWLDIA